MSRIYNEMIDTVITFFRQSLNQIARYMQSNFLKTFIVLQLPVSWIGWYIGSLTQQRGAGERSDFNQIYFLPNLVCTTRQRYSFVHI